jgi:hypothetical protein
MASAQARNAFKKARVDFVIPSMHHSSVEGEQQCAPASAGAHFLVV